MRPHDHKTKLLDREVARAFDQSERISARFDNQPFAHVDIERIWSRASEKRERGRT